MTSDHLAVVWILASLVVLNALASVVALSGFRRSGLWIYAVGACLSWAGIGYLVAALTRD